MAQPLGMCFRSRGAVKKAPALFALATSPHKVTAPHCRERSARVETMSWLQQRRGLPLWSICALFHAVAVGRESFPKLFCCRGCIEPGVLAGIGSLPNTSQSSADQYKKP